METNKDIDISKKNNLIKCIFLLPGVINIKYNKTKLLKLTEFLKKEYDLNVEIKDDKIYNKELFIIIHQDKLNSLSKVKKKIINLIDFLSDDIYYGIINTKKNDEVGKFPFKTTNFYKNYFCWIQNDYKIFNKS